MSQVPSRRIASSYAGVSSTALTLRKGPVLAQGKTPMSAKCRFSRRRAFHQRQAVGLYRYREIRAGDKEAQDVSACCQERVFNQQI
jgi:hypothetical protein